jgi:hypothetical protein
MVLKSLPFDIHALPEEIVIYCWMLKQFFSIVFFPSISCVENSQAVIMKTVHRNNGTTCRKDLFKLQEFGPRRYRRYKFNPKTTDSRLSFGVSKKNTEVESFTSSPLNAQMPRKALTCARGPAN